MQRVRTALSRQFRTGEDRVRDVPQGANFLDLQAHWEAVVRGLIDNAPAIPGFNRASPAWQPESLQIVCINLENIHITSFEGVMKEEMSRHNGYENWIRAVPLMGLFVPDPQRIFKSTNNIIDFNPDEYIAISKSCAAIKVEVAFHLKNLYPAT